MRYRTLLILLLCNYLTLTSLHAAEDPEARARRLINSFGCKGCHLLDGDGGSLAPPLDGVSTRLNGEQILQRMTGQIANPKAFMPSYATTPKQQLEVIRDFLARQKQ